MPSKRPDSGRPALNKPTTAACTAPGCERQAVARGLCMLHYKRARAGRPLMDGPEVGSPDGHGRYGILDDDGDRVMCHECGRWYANLAAHAAVHGLSARQYKLRHGLPLSRSLSPSKLREARSRAASDHVGSQGWQRLEKARNPARAAQARDPESFVSPYATRRHREYSPRAGRAWSFMSYPGGITAPRKSEAPTHSLSHPPNQPTRTGAEPHAPRTAWSTPAATYTNSQASTMNVGRS